MADVLLTVSGTIPLDLHEQIRAGTRPRADYLEMAHRFGADLIDIPAARRATGLIGRLIERLGGPFALLAWACFVRRKHYRVIFTDGEQVGIYLALFCSLFGFFRPRRFRHLMIVHILSVPKKMLFFDLFGLHRHIDLFFVYSTWQKRFIERRWKVASEQVVFTPFMVDETFFAPDQVVPQLRDHPQICAVGLEARDYQTLLKAVEGLPANLVIAAASPWSRRADTTRNERIPENVSVRRFSQYDLRQLYADSHFLVMPLQNVNFQAGVTAILEAMAMGKAVICSRTPGQSDVVVDGKTGVYVAPADVRELRLALERLLGDPAEAERMGHAGRRRIEQGMGLDAYVERLTHYVQRALANTTPPDQIEKVTS